MKLLTLYETGGACALGMGLDLTSQRPRCFRMALMTSMSSMALMILMVPWHPRLHEDKLRAGKGIDLIDFLNQS